MENKVNDVGLARKYLSKADRANKSGITFTISFMSYKNLMLAKKCKFTGILLTSPRPDKPIRSSDRTIDRLDNNLGYIPGNVVAVCHSANALKAVWENPNNQLSIDLVKKMINKIDRLQLAKGDQDDSL